MVTNKCPVHCDQGRWSTVARYVPAARDADIQRLRTPPAAHPKIARHDGVAEHGSAEIRPARPTPLGEVSRMCQSSQSELLHEYPRGVHRHSQPQLARPEPPHPVLPRSTSHCSVLSARCATGHDRGCRQIPPSSRQRCALQPARQISDSRRETSTWPRPAIRSRLPDVD